ncbi:MAG: dihydrofolate reductase family protein, partial [bacterium]|nr:dihydrofolate reductase family protein [bacterium]
DGKISSGDTDKLDVDRDWKRIKGVREGLWQYYALEKKTDLCFFISGRVLAKIGTNSKTKPQYKLPVTAVIIDNKPHLNQKGLTYLSSWLKKVIIVTTNKKHPAQESFDNIEVVEYRSKINFVDLFKKLKTKYKINRITIQSGGSLNTKLLRDGLIDHLSIVIAPILIGGQKTPTLLDGETPHSIKELKKLKALKLTGVKRIKSSYLHLQYDVIQKTTLD